MDLHKDAQIWLAELEQQDLVELVQDEVTKARLIEIYLDANDLNALGQQREQN